MSSGDDRHFPNGCDDYSSTAAAKFLNEHGELTSDFRKDLETEISRLCIKLEKRSEDIGEHDHSVYTGHAGIALLYMHLYKNFPPFQKYKYLKIALSHVEPYLSKLKLKRPSFICGEAGILAVGAVLLNQLNMKEKAEDCVKNLLKFGREVSDVDDKMPDEVLYGRAGYLFSLLYVKTLYDSDAVSSAAIESVVEALIHSGKALALEEKSKFPLMYKWHDKHYLGAAHGIVGILYMLLQAGKDLIEEYVENLIKPTLDQLLLLRFPSGNYPSSVSNTSDKLVQWCHGAPGFVLLFCRASEVFDDQKYLDAAQDAAECVWERGLLQKGYGLCHGAAGNGYAFLELYKLTKDVKHLYRAIQFARFCMDYGDHGCRTPDRPLSLFEGLAGTIYFLADLLNPKRAAFPGFGLD
ncbi:lanC-like protein 2 [Paramacrobiotus metropolitanus]|uniref:lanC-like protein 2 n=1 Tax=Paramacrobiotus metropolitanus TaxID=2943436 RepID=UPI002446395D|nr:lanC-like protein 2 [Paramacrobiotus metropolitanus]